MQATRKLIILLALICLVIPTAAQTKPEPKRTHCTIQTDRTLACFDEESEKEFSLTVGDNHPWAERLKDAPEGATVIIEGRGREVCLMQIHFQDGWVKNSVNERINICVAVKQSAKRKR